MSSHLPAILLIIAVATDVCMSAAIRCYGDSMDTFDEYELDDAEKILESDYFVKGKYTFVFVHGYQGRVDGRAVRGMVTAAIHRGGWNVCILNWSQEASSVAILGDSTTAQQISYGIKAFPQSRLVGTKFGETLVRLSDRGWNVEDTHIYGHSLGAHLAGFAGRTAKKGGKIIKRITGLDPARSLFERPSLQEPLGPGDARTVDCVHTDPGGFGFNSSLGDIDIWINYGNFLHDGDDLQPGCPEGDFDEFSVENLCSHDFSWRVTAQAFRQPDLFLASFANNYPQWKTANGTNTPITRIAEELDTTLRGNFFMRTSGEEPYGLGEQGLFAE